MDLLSLIFILLIAILGGVIAFLADRMGRSIGKKRLSVGGLRPKHTATLILVLAGFLIPLLTVGLLAALSAEYRIWLVKGQQALREARRAQQEMAATREQLERARAEAAATIMRLKTDEQAARRQRDAARSEARESSRLAETLRAQASALAADVRRIKAELDSSRQRVEALRGEAERLRAANRERDARYRVLESKLRETEDYQIRLDQEVREKETEARRLAADVQSLTEQLARLRATADEANARFAEEIRRKQEELETATRELERARLDIDAAKAEVDQLRALGRQILGALDAARSREMIFAMGEEIARLAVPRTESADEARNAVTSLLRITRIHARERGASGPAPESPAAGLRDLPTDRGNLTVDQQIERLVTEIVGRREPSVLIAYSSWNAFAGEFVPVFVRLYPNPQIFSRGQLIAEARIDGNQSEEGIVQQITEFLRGTVRSRARERGLIPASGRDDQFGTVSSDDVLALVREIRSLGRPVKLLALAAEDTRAADSLRLAFRIE